MADFIAQNFQYTSWVLPLITVAPLILFFGSFVFVQNVRSPTHIMFFTLTIAMNLWFLGWALVTLSTNAEIALFFYRTIVFLGVAFLSTVVYAFSVFWLDLYAKQKYWVIGGLTGSVVFYLLSLFSPYSYAGMKHHYWGYFPKYGIANFFFILMFYTYYTAAFANFAISYFKEKEKQRKKQIGLISLAFVIALTASVDFLPKFFDTSLYPIGYVSIFLWVTMVSYAIVSYKAMDIETVLHKTLLWFASTVLTILPFAYLFHMSQEWIRDVPGFVRTAYYLVLFVGFYFYFRAVQPFLGHLFRRKRSNLSKVVSRFSGELVHLQNLRDLLKRFVRLLQRTVYATEISVMLKDEAEDQFVPVIAKGVRGMGKVDAAHPFLTWMEKKDQIVVTALAEVNPETEPFRKEMQDYFEQMRAVVVVPFILGGKLIAILHLGKKENLRRYSAGEINFLAQLKHPMTIAFSNSKQLEDISRLYKQVQSQNDRLKELDRLKSEFLANTSHELRTPIHGILGLVESILDGSDGAVNDAQAKHLGMIIQSGTNLKELINNLLELSRIESGQEEFEQKNFNVLNVVDAVLALTDSLAKKKGLKVSRVASQAGTDVYGDPAKIQRVIMNLVGNAIKFTDKGSVCVRVGEDSGRVQVAVEDTGVGIPTEKQKVIFERFRQVDGSTTRRFEGTGLGLSIAKEIVERHGSDIAVRSEPGKGSVFSFSLSKEPFTAEQTKTDARETGHDGKAIPAVKQAAQEQREFGGPGFDKEYELRKDAEYLEAVRGRGEKILIIDDNEVNREVVRTRLELNKYKVIEAADGLDGLEKLNQDKPDLVILDLMMPKMSGYEFCKQLREKHSADELPVIMLTAKTEMGDKVYGLSLGANDYISKPFNKEELVARIAVLLRIREMNRELRKLNDSLEDKVEERTKELIRTQDQLIQAEKLATVGTMAGGIAHEINNPLTAVLTNAQMLKMMNAYDPAMIDLIEQGAKRCQLIIQKLMKYTRKPREEGVQEKIDLNTVIKNVVAMLVYQFEQENIKVTADLNGPVSIFGTSNELEQVFTNLLVNARDAIRAAKRKGVITISVKTEAGFAEARVADNGNGIPKEILTKIFDPFFTTKDVGEGTGLGLSISFGIVQRHKGEIRAESKQGEGTTFFVRFPIAVDELVNK